MRKMLETRKLKKTLAVLFAACSWSASAAAAAPRELTLAECVGIALDHHPSLTESKAAVKAEESRLEGLKANDRFSLGAGTSYSYSDSLNGSVTGENHYEVSVTGSKVLYDSGKNRLSKSAQRLSIQQAGEGEAASRLTVVTDVERAYYGLLLAHRNLEVVQDKLRNLSAHLERAQGYYEVGSRPRIDITKAEVDLANERVNALSAEGKVRLAYEALLVAMGSMDQEPFGLSTPLDAPEIEADASRMTELALAERPDYRKAELAVAAADVSVQSAARSNAPTVTASAGPAYRGSDFPLSDSLTARVSVEFSVYDGGKRDAAVEVARSQRTQAEAALEAMRQKIVYEVRQAVLDLQNAQARIQAADEVLQYARENLDLARGRYDTGVGNPLEVSDAVSELSQALYTRYQALHDARTAVVSLEKATGRLLGL